MKYYLFSFLLCLAFLSLKAQPFAKDVLISNALMDMDKGDVEWCDFDVDGDLDIFICGYSANGPFSALYKNEDSLFTQMNIGFIGLDHSQASWNDFDLDGDPDIFLTGTNLAGLSMALLYENTGNDTFEELSTSIQPNYNGASVWADLDNDGDEDLITIGNSGSGGDTRIYRNDNMGQFTDMPHNLSNVYKGEVDVGDYDMDMDLDILMIGLTKDLQGNEQKILRIYPNNGDFQFSELSSGFVGMSESNCQWGDYDGDGDLDILANGSTEAPTHLVYIYQNMGNDEFLNIGIEIFGSVLGTIDWGDYDNDGDLDFLLTGDPSYGDDPITEIYRNVGINLFNKADENIAAVKFSIGKWGDMDGDGDLDLLLMGQQGSGANISAVYNNKNLLTNAQPDSPEGLSSEVINNGVILTWNPSSDPETADSSLSYNLRVGHAESNQIVMSSLTSESGKRLLMSMGNVSQNSQWQLTGLDPGIYYWNVQALDNHFEASLFSDTAYFTIETVSIKKTSSNSDLVQVFPNPFSNILTVRFLNQLAPGPIRIRIYSKEGQLVYESTLENEQIDFNNFSHSNAHVIQPKLKKGVYFLELFSKTSQKRLSLVKVLKHK